MEISIENEELLLSFLARLEALREDIKNKEPQSGVQLGGLLEEAEAEVRRILENRLTRAYRSIRWPGGY